MATLTSSLFLVIFVVAISETHQANETGSNALSISTNHSSETNVSKVISKVRGQVLNPNANNNLIADSGSQSTQETIIKNAFCSDLSRMGYQCRIRDGIAKAIDQDGAEFCPVQILLRGPDFVCGSDGKLYLSRYDLFLNSCKTNTPISIKYDEEETMLYPDCKTRLAHDTGAYVDVDVPVCGSDGKLYADRSRLLLKNCLAKTRISLKYDEDETKLHPDCK